MSKNGTPLSYITTCKLCPQRFSYNALPIIGDVPDAHTRHLIEMLIKHLAQNHKQQFMAFSNAMRLLANKFAAWLALQSFEISDPNLLNSQEELRAWVHALTRKNQLTDAEITDKIVSAEPITAEKAIAICKELRNFLTEQAQYGQPTGLVT